MSAIPRRVNVIGTSGSGKSTFGRRLAEVLACECIELDRLHWRPKWQETPREELLQTLQEYLLGDEWVLDGNYTHTIPVKWRSADHVVWLDYSFGVTVFRAFRRAVNRSFTKVEIWEGTGNRESFRRTFFSKDSPLYWTITSYVRVRRHALAALRDEKFAHIKFVRLRTPREANAYLKRIAEEVLQKN